MKLILLIIIMLFCHLIDDYYLQGILASMKQKSWWEKNNPNPLYKNDYRVALIEHAFSWTFMIHLPILIWILTHYSEMYAATYLYTFALNWIIHIITDDLKANKGKINLIIDQSVHVVQVILTAFLYAVIY